MNCYTDKQTASLVTMTIVLMEISLPITVMVRAAGQNDCVHSLNLTLNNSLCNNPRDGMEPAAVGDGDYNGRKSTQASRLSEAGAAIVVPATPPAGFTPATSTVDLVLCSKCLAESSGGTVTALGLIVGVVFNNNNTCRDGGEGIKERMDATSRNLSSYPSWAVAAGSNFNFKYRATPDDWHESLLNRSEAMTFTLGSDGSCDVVKVSQYCNGPLPRDVDIMISVIKCNAAGCDYITVDGVFTTKARNVPPFNFVGFWVGVSMGLAVVLTGIVLCVVSCLLEKRLTKSYDLEDSVDDSQTGKTYTVTDAHALSDVGSDRRNSTISGASIAPSTSGVGAGVCIAAGSSPRVEEAHGSLAGAGIAAGSSSRVEGAGGSLAGGGIAAGSSSLVEGPGGSLSGVGFAAGSSSRVERACGSLTGAGIAAGSSSRVERSRGSLTGAGIAAGSSSRVERSCGSLTGAGIAAGSSSRVERSCGSLTGAGIAAGSSSRVERSCGSLTGAGIAAGSSSRVERACGSLTGAGIVAGSSSRVERACGSLTGAGIAAGSSSRVERACGSLTGAGIAAGSSSRVERACGSLTGAGIAAGSSSRVERACGSLTGAGIAAGSSSRVERACGSLTGAGIAAGSSSRVERACGSLTFNASPGSDFELEIISQDDIESPDGVSSIAEYEDGRRSSLRLSMSTLM